MINRNVGYTLVLNENEEYKLLQNAISLCNNKKIETIIILKGNTLHYNFSLFFPD